MGADPNQYYLPLHPIHSNNTHHFNRFTKGYPPAILILLGLGGQSIIPSFTNPTAAFLQRI
jgi:hypothetical protein